MLNKTALMFVVLTAAILSAGPAQAGLIYWDGSDNTTWATGGNWSTGGVPVSSDTAVFNAELYSPIYQPNVAANTTVGALQFTTGTWSLAGGLLRTQYKLTLNGVSSTGITNSVGNNIINSDIGLGASQTWSIASGTSLRVGGAISGAYNLTVSGGGTLVVGGPATIGSSAANILSVGSSTTVKLTAGAYTINPASAYPRLEVYGVLDFNGTNLSCGDVHGASAVNDELYGTGDVTNTDPIRQTTLITATPQGGGTTTFAGRIRGNLSFYYGGGATGRNLYLTGGTSDLIGSFNLDLGQATTGWIYLRNSAKISQASAINVHGGGISTGTLLLDDNGGTAYSDRLGDTVPVNLRGGTLYLRGRNNATSTETAGVITLDSGANALTAEAGTGTGTATLTVNSVARSTRRGTLMVTATNLGGTAKIKATNAPTVTNGMVEPWILTSTVQFATYDSVLGFKQATVTDSAAFASGQEVTIVSLTASPTLSGDADVYALNANTQSITYSTTPRTVTVRSGGIINTGAVTYDSNFKFGAAGDAEGVIYNAFNLSIGSATNNTGYITTTGGLTKWGAGTLTLQQRTLGNGTPSNWSGQTTVNGGTLTFRAVAGDSNGYFVPGDLAISDATVTLTAANQINPASKVSLNSRATFNVNSNQTIAKLSLLDNTAGFGSTFDNAVVVGTNATLKLGGDLGYAGPDVVASGAAIPSRYLVGAPTTIYQTTYITGGTLDLNGPRTIHAEAGHRPSNPTLTIFSKITDTGTTHGLTKTGDGLVLLYNTANTFAGDITVKAGILWGQGASDTANSLYTTSSSKKNLTLQGLGSVWLESGAYNVYMGALTFAGSNAVYTDAPKISFTGITRSDRATLTLGCLIYAGIGGSASSLQIKDVNSLADAPVVGGMTLPYFVTWNGVNRTADFATYDTNGFTSATYTTPISGNINDVGAGDAGKATIFRAAMNQTLTADRTVEALRVDADIAGNHLLTIWGNQTSSNAYAGLIVNLESTIASNLKFGDTGAAEGLIYVSNTNTSTISGTITTSAGLTKFGAGTLLLTGDNSSTLTGSTCETWINDGVLKLGNAGALGASGVVLTGGTATALHVATATANVAYLADNDTSGTYGRVIIGTTSTPATLTLNGSSTKTFKGVISNFVDVDNSVAVGSLTVNLTGGGSQTLSGANTYTGLTTINGGTLRVDGSLAAGSAVAVNDGGTLGGTGTIYGPVTINAGGYLAPGNSPGVETFAGNLTINGTYTWELADKTEDLGTAPNYKFDQAIVGGTLDIGTGAVLDLDFATGVAPSADPFWSTEHAWVIINGITSDENFTQANIANEYLTLGRFSTSNVGGDVTLHWQPVPEPATLGFLALGGLSMLGAAIRRRRRAD